ncbi:MAG TPA: hypothetical protein VJJ02_04595 [Candidatus Paceibacterota bacterium]
MTIDEFLNMTPETAAFLLMLAVLIIVLAGFAGEHTWKNFRQKRKGGDGPQS